MEEEGGSGTETGFGSHTTSTTTTTERLHDRGEEINRRRVQAKFYLILRCSVEIVKSYKYGPIARE